MTDALSRLTGLRSQVDALRKQMKETAQEAVKEGTKDIFAEYDDILHSFGWTQYTPYFNDGEPCEFSMGELFVIAKEDIKKLRDDAPEWEQETDDDIIHENDWSYEGSPAFSTYSDESKISAKYSGNEPESRYVDCQAACAAVYGVLDNDTAREIFGDHVRVLFTSDGVDVDEYSHD